MYYLYQWIQVFLVENGASKIDNLTTSRYKKKFNLLLLTAKSILHLDRKLVENSNFVKN